VNRSPVAVIAVGNEMRGDDAAGLEVASRLEARLPAGVDLLRTRGDAAVLLELWRDRALAVVVDAVSGGGDGELLEIDVLAEGLPADLASASTHDFGLAQALELGRLMDVLPGALLLVGIIGTRFGIGDELSEPVAGTLDRAAERVMNAIEKTEVG